MSKIKEEIENQIKTDYRNGDFAVKKEIKEKIKDWEKELSELCFEIRDRTYGSHYRILVKFIRQLLAEEKQKWIGEIEKELQDWGRVSESKETPKLEGEEFEDGWRLGINRVCNSIRDILGRINLK